MPEKTCNTCANWKPQKSYHGGLCQLQFDDNAPIWSSLYDLVLTAPDFGCNRWEQRKEDA